MLAVTQDVVTEEDFESVPARLLAQLALQLTLVVGAWTLSRRYGTGRLKTDLRLFARPVDVPIGVLSGMVAQAGIYVLYLPLLQLFDGLDESLAKVARDIFENRSPWETAILVVALVVATPLVEELFFRGVVLQALRRSFSLNMAIGLSALIFAVPHRQPLALVAFALLGCLFAWLVERYGRLGPAIVAHATFNGITVIGLLL